MAYERASLLKQARERQKQGGLVGEFAFSIIGGSGNKTFTDESLPLGTDSVQYIVTAIRGSVNGIPSNSFTVQFGVGDEGFSVAKANVKLAAYRVFASRVRIQSAPVQR